VGRGPRRAREDDNGEQQDGRERMPT